MKRRRFSVLRIFHSRGDVSSAHSVKQQREASANEPLRVNRDHSHHTSRITGGDMYVRAISSSTALKIHRKYIDIKVAVCRDCMCMYVFFWGGGDNALFITEGPFTSNITGCCNIACSCSHKIPISGPLQQYMVPLSLLDLLSASDSNPPWAFHPDGKHSSIQNQQEAPPQSIEC